MRTPLLLASLLSATVLVGACDLKPPPPTDPDATAQARKDNAADAAARNGARHELQDAIDSVDKRERAEHANDPVEDADKRREQELKDAGG